MIATLTACCDSSTGDESSSGEAESESGATAGSSTGEFVGWGGVCYVDLDCGGGGEASCEHHDGCAKPGKCGVVQPQGECPDDPSPRIPRPEGFPCMDDSICVSKGGRECFFYDGRCGLGYYGVCLLPAECEAAIPEEITERCPGSETKQCPSPKYETTPS